MDEIVVIGGGGHAKVVMSVLKKSGYNVAGYTDRADRGLILGTPYLGNDGVLADFIRTYAGCKAIIGVGKVDDSQRRLNLQNQSSALGFDFPVIRSPHAIVKELVLLGPGTVVLDGAVVNSGAQIGEACILNTNSTVEHDCWIGKNVHIAPGATLSGGVSIGDNCLIGVGANIVQSVSVCGGCLIGAGSTVVKDITVPGTYVGNPTKRIR